jgi:hypothetical protein
MHVVLLLIDAALEVDDAMRRPHVYVDQQQLAVIALQLSRYT